MTLNENHIREELKLTEGENDLIAGSETGSPSQINKARTFTEIYVVKNMRDAIKELIESNEKLSDSNDRNAKALNKLTCYILIVAILQVIVGVFITLFK